MNPKYFIEKMKNYQRSLLEYIDDEKNLEENYINLLKLFKTQKIQDDQKELKLLFTVILNIANNHHRSDNFYCKIEKILDFFKDDFPNFFTNSELFDFFQDNKMILLYLMKEKLLIVNKSISAKIISSIHKIAKYSRFFFPEIKPFIKKSSIEIPENFEENRQIGENESEICQIIRQDLIEDFIIYVNKKTLPLTMQVHHSVYESNLFLIKNEKISLIEYAAFFGATQIFKYLFMNDVSFGPTIWLYAVHSDNPEIIHILEENGIKNPSFVKCYKEAIKCYHNDVANYIKTNHMSNYNEKKEIKNVQFLNFDFFNCDFNTNEILFNLIEYDLYELFLVFINSPDFDINYVNKNQTLLIKGIENNSIEIVKKLLENPKIDVNLRPIYKHEDNKWFSKKSALHVAIEQENIEMIKLLLSYKETDINLICVESNDEEEIERETAKEIKKEEGKFTSDNDTEYIKRIEKTGLHIAIKTNNSDIVQLLLENSSTDVNIPYICYIYSSYLNMGFEDGLKDDSKSTRTVLDYAIQNGLIEIIQLLLMNPNIKINEFSTKTIYTQYYEDLKIYVNRIETATRTPLFYALAHSTNDLSIVELLLKQPEIDVNCSSHLYDTKNFFDKVVHKRIVDQSLIKSSDVTPLSLAYEAGNIEMIDLLLSDPKIDLTMKSFNGDTILLNVCKNNKIEIEKRLLNHSNIDVNQVDDEGRTALYYACKSGNNAIVELLLDNPKIDVNKVDNEGTTALHCACKNEDEDIIELLLDNPKIDINLVDNKGKTALYYARENDEIVKLFIYSQKTDVNKVDDEIKTALYHADKDEELVKLYLYGQEIDVNKVDDEGKTILHRTCEKEGENEEIVKLLLHKPNIDINKVDNKGKTALHYACENKNEEIVKLLLDNPKIVVDEVDNKGKTALHYACKNGNIEIVEQLLLYSCIDVNAKTYSCKTPLYYAYHKNHMAIVQLLVRNPMIDMDIEIEDGKTLLYLAIEEENIKLIKMILNNPKVDFDNHLIEKVIDLGNVEIYRLLLKYSYGTRADFDEIWRDRLGNSQFRMMKMTFKIEQPKYNSPFSFHDKYD